jgi:hypothetical protein
LYHVSCCFSGFRHVRFIVPNSLFPRRSLVVVLFIAIIVIVLLMFLFPA